MGVAGLLSLVRPFLKQTRLQARGFGAIGLDASMLIHALLRVHAERVARGDWQTFDAAFADHLRFLVTACVALHVVFDGMRPLAKVAAGERILEREHARQQLETFGGDVLRGVAAAVAAEDVEEDGDSGEASAAARPVRDKLLCRAIGARAPEAARRCQALCRSMGIAFTVAPAEAEQQLVHLQRRGVVTHIFANDSDYLTLGADNVCFGLTFMSGAVDMLSWDALTAALASGTLPNGRKHSAEWADVMKKHGAQKVLRMASYFLPNDYGRLPRLGRVTFLAALRRLGDVALSLPALAAELAGSSQLSVTRIRLVAEIAATMFHGQPVFSSVDNGSDDLVVTVPLLPNDCGDCSALWGALQVCVPSSLVAAWQPLTRSPLQPRPSPHPG